MELRPYQQAAVAAVYDYLRAHDDNPCVVIPTAGGKTLVMATICRDAVSRWGNRVLILAHVKELLAQIADTMRVVCPDIPFGIYSAGLQRRDIDAPVIIAGIQSVYQRADALGAFDVILIDEAHCIPIEDDGMYRQFLAAAKYLNAHLRIIGFTATPFRLQSGMICDAPNILNHICFDVSVRELIRDAYLSPLITKAGVHQADFGQLRVRAGEFIADEMEHLMNQTTLVEAACAEIVAYTQDRRAVLIFASGVQHAHHIQRVLHERHGVECGLIYGDTPADERADTLRRFRLGALKYLANVNVLTHGFDAPHIDCVAMLRPTMSPGLYYQMVGRGFRRHPHKLNCLILDYGGNVLRHGPVDQLRVPKTAGNGSGQAPAKECPACHSIIAAGYAVCPDCGHAFPPPVRQQHDATASSAGILSGQSTDTECPVWEIVYLEWQKRGAPADAPKTMRVEYRIGFRRSVSEFIHFERTGFLRRKAEAWWRQRSIDPVPATAAEAVRLARAGTLAPAETITVRTTAGKKYNDIVGHKLGPIPSLADIPF